MRLGPDLKPVLGSRSLAGGYTTFYCSSDIRLIVVFSVDFCFTRAVSWLRAQFKSRTIRPGYLRATFRPLRDWFCLSVVVVIVGLSLRALTGFRKLFPIVRFLPLQRGFRQFLIRLRIRSDRQKDYAMAANRQSSNAEVGFEWIYTVQLSCYNGNNSL